MLRRVLVRQMPTIAGLCLLLEGSATRVEANLILDPGFELRPPGTNIFTGSDFTAASIDKWTINSAIIVTAQGGVTPLDGSQMLKANSGLSTDVFYLIDMLANGISAVDVDAGRVRVDYTGHFNALGRAACSLSLGGFAGLPVFNFAGQLGYSNSPSLLTDAVAATWESIQMQGYVIPAGARYLSAGLHMPFGPGLPAAYSDGMALTVEVIPEPATLVLLGAGLLASFTVRGRFHRRILKSPAGPVADAMHALSAVRP